MPNKEKETNIALNVPRETVGSSTVKEQWLQYAQNHINVTQEFWEFCSVERWNILELFGLMDGGRRMNHMMKTTRFTWSNVAKKPDLLI